MCKILHVEDSTLQKTLVDMIFAKQTAGSFSVVHASTLAEALRKLEADTFDIIIADLNLPDSGRDTTIPSIKSTCGDIPIIVVSCEDNLEIALQAVRDGVDYFLNKSWELKQLPYAVLTVLEKRKLSKEMADNLKMAARSQMTDVKKMATSLDKTISKSKETTRKLLEYRRKRAVVYGGA